MEEMEAGGLEVKGHKGAYFEFEGILNYIKLSLKYNFENR